MQLSNMLRTVGNALEIKRLMNGVRHIEPNDFLHRVGLERQRSTMETVLPALGFFAAGAAVGVGLAVLFTPSSGPEVRGKIAKAVVDAKHKVEGMLAIGEEETDIASGEAATDSGANGRSGRRTHSTRSL